MSEKAKGVLARLEEELGGVIQVKNFIVKELKALEEELEELVGDDNKLAQGAGLCGHGAGEAPGNVPAPVETAPTTPASLNAAASNGVADTILADGANSTPTPATGTVPSEPTSVPDAGEASTAAGADTAAAVSASGPAVDASAANNAGESAGDGNTAQTTTSAPLPDAPAPVSDGAKVAE